MAVNRYQQAAERLKQASRLGQRRAPVTTRDNFLAPPPHRPMPPPIETNRSDGAPVTNHYHLYQPPEQYRPRPVKLGFGLGLGFAAGGAVFRLIAFMIFVALLVMFLSAGLSILGF